jgi:hypothetical protein
VRIAREALAGVGDEAAGFVATFLDGVEIP